MTADRLMPAPDTPYAQLAATVESLGWNGQPEALLPGALAADAPPAWKGKPEESVVVRTREELFA